MDNYRKGEAMIELTVEQSVNSWRDDEWVVRKAHEGYVVRSQWLGDYSYDGNYIEVAKKVDDDLIIGDGTDGEWHHIGQCHLQDPSAAWADARKHPFVKNYERTHNPAYAKPPQPAEPPAQTAETVMRPVRGHYDNQYRWQESDTLGDTYKTSQADAYMDAQEATIIKLREELASLRKGIRKVIQEFQDAE